jgi:glycosyltransferase involved in cell wall biosynthesis
MRIAFLLDTFPSNTETFIAREIEALRRRGFGIEVFAFNAGAGATAIAQPLRMKLSPRRWELVGRALDLSGFAHVHAGWANHLSDVARATARANDISWSFSAHARDLWVEGGDLKSKLASAHFASSCTRAGFEHLRSFGDNVIYAPHGLEIARYPFREPDLKGERKLVGVGRLVEKKGWGDAEMAAHYTQSRLTIFSGGPPNERRAGGPEFYSPEVRSAMPHEQLIEELREFNCLILPSKRTRQGDRDGLANVLLEAGALGLPLITTNAGSASDFVDETTGLLVEASNYLELEKAIRRVFKHKDDTLWRCRNARKRVEERFDVDKNIAVLANAFGS